MKTLNDLRKQHPELDYLSDQQLEEVRDSLYALARVVLALYKVENGSKNEQVLEAGVRFG
jgi:hypothetical protein